MIQRGSDYGPKHLEALDLDSLDNYARRSGSLLVVSVPSASATKLHPLPFCPFRDIPPHHLAFIGTGIDVLRPIQPKH